MHSGKDLVRIDWFSLTPPIWTGFPQPRSIENGESPILRITLHESYIMLNLE